MRAAWGPSALLIALLVAQPTLAALHTVSGEAPSASAQVEAGEADPLRRLVVLYLTADGGMAHDAPAAGSVVAPQALPGGEGVVVWAHEAEHAASFEGDVGVTVPMRVHLPALTANSIALFTVSLLQAGEPVATAEAGPQVLLPGETTVHATLPAAGVSFAQGEALGLSVAARALSTGPGPAPSLEYLVGPEGANLTFALRFASLDALGHQHGPSDRHVLRSEFQGPRSGDLGNGVWGIDVQVPPLGPAPEIVVPASAQRLRFHVAHSPNADKESYDVALPGGPLQVHAGEVVLREATMGPAPDKVACVSCDGGPVDVVRLLRAPEVVVQPNGEPLQQNSVPPRGLGDAYAEAGWLLLLFLPAAIMLVASIGYVMAHEEPPARAPPPRARPANGASAAKPAAKPVLRVR